MKAPPTALLGLAGVLLLAPFAQAADPRHPDWPCQQIKVPSLSVAAMWTGPPLEDAATTWQQQPQIAQLVGKLAERRLPEDEAERLIAEFLRSQNGSRRHAAMLLFAGLFDTLNRERSTVMDGIERFARKERTFAAKIRADAAELRAAQSSSQPDPKRLDELANQVSWETRIYEDRQQTISYVCEVPQLIERRLFAFARVIEQEIE